MKLQVFLPSKLDVSHFGPLSIMTLHENVVFGYLATLTKKYRAFLKGVVLDPFSLYKATFLLGDNFEAPVCRDVFQTDFPLFIG